MRITPKKKKRIFRYRVNQDCVGFSAKNFPTHQDEREDAHFVEGL